MQRCTPHQSCTEEQEEAIKEGVEEKEEEGAGEGRKRKEVVTRTQNSEKNNGPRWNDEGQGLNDEGQGLNDEGRSLMMRGSGFMFIFYLGVYW